MHPMTMSRLALVGVMLASTWATLLAQQPVEPMMPDRVAAAVRAAPGTGPRTRLCRFSAYLTDRDPAGTRVRLGPGASARVLKTIPNGRDEAGDRIAPEFQVIGSQDGWLLVRNIGWAGYDLDTKTIEHGPGWIAASLVGVSIEGQSLRERPESRSPLVTTMLGQRPDGSQLGPGDVRLIRIHGCSGSMMDVTVQLPTGKSVRGWADGACANQVTTCGGGHRLVVEKGGALFFEDQL